MTSSLRRQYREGKGSNYTIEKPDKYGLGQVIKANIITDEPGRIVEILPYCDENGTVVFLLKPVTPV